MRIDLDRFGLIKIALDRVDWFSLVWTDWAGFGLIKSDLDWFGLNWTDWDWFELVWTDLDCFTLILVRFGSILADLDRFVSIRTNLHRLFFFSLYDVLMQSSFAAWVYTFLEYSETVVRQILSRQTRNNTSKLTLGNTCRHWAPPRAMPEQRIPRSKKRSGRY